MLYETNIDNFHYEPHQFSNFYHGFFPRTSGDYEKISAKGFFLFNRVFLILKTLDLIFETTMDSRRMIDCRIPPPLGLSQILFFFLLTRLAERGFFMVISSHFSTVQYVKIIPVLKPGLNYTNTFDRLTSRRRRVHHDLIFKQLRKNLNFFNIFVQRWKFTRHIFQ